MNSAIDRLRQRLDAGASLPWHSHDTPYAAVVLDGDYEEAGDGGRRRVGPGHLVIHPPVSAHADAVGKRGATIVNLPPTVADALTLRSGTLADPEAILRRYADDASCFVEALRSGVASVAGPDDLPDQLAAALEMPGGLASPSGERRTAAQVDPSRASSRRPVESPRRTSAGVHARTRGAWRALITTDQPLVQIAHDWGVPTRHI